METMLYQTPGAAQSASLTPTTGMGINRLRGQLPRHKCTRVVTNLLPCNRVRNTQRGSDPMTTGRQRTMSMILRLLLVGLQSRNEVYSPPFVLCSPGSSVGGFPPCISTPICVLARSRRSSEERMILSRFFVLLAAFTTPRTAFFIVSSLLRAFQSFRL